MPSATNLVDPKEDKVPNILWALSGIFGDNASLFGNGKMKKGYGMILSPPKLKSPNFKCAFELPTAGCITITYRLFVFIAVILLPVAVNAASLQQPLSSFDIAQYKRLLELQKAGNMKQAIREMGRVRDPLLKGHVLAQRYLHPQHGDPAIRNYLVGFYV